MNTCRTSIAFRHLLSSASLAFIGLISIHVSAIASSEGGWHIGNRVVSLSAPAAINTATVQPGPHKIIVAVIDSGVITNHPSLKGVLLPGYDMISGERNIRKNRSSDFTPDPRNARCGERLVSSSFRTHGTEVSSLIAANGHGGMSGINPAAKIVPIRVFGACGMSVHDMIDSIKWAAGIPVANLPLNPNPARIINISISGGSRTCSPRLQEAIDSVLKKNIFVVAAAGNNFNRPLEEPANCKGVISVGAVSADNRIERYSALDSRTVIYAPGGGQKIKTNAEWSVNKLRVATFEPTLVGGESAVVKEAAVGTSFAAPVVSGYIALWLSYYPNQTPKDWMAMLPSIKRPVSPVEKCPNCVPASLVSNLNVRSR
jgi:serine protease